MVPERILGWGASSCCRTGWACRRVRHHCRYGGGPINDDVCPLEEELSARCPVVRFLTIPSRLARPTTLSCRARLV